jgi:hypothetical protein
MIPFKKFITEQKNTHMTHIEDAVIHGGVNGTRQAIMGLRGLRDMLQGTHKGGLSVKWDGAPAVFAGIDPGDQQFFVAKKGIFNKNPMVYKTKADVDADTSGELNAKLNEALLYLPQLGIKNVIQGDFLYSKSDIKTQKIDGQDYVTFHPNTIVYAVPVGSDMAKDILNSKIGIVWHTSYTGTTFESMKAKFGADVSKLSKSKDVWSQDAMLKDITQATLTADDTTTVNEKLSAIGSLFNKISGNVLKELGSNPALSQQIETFNNSFVRAGELVKDTEKHTEALVKYIENKFQKEIDKRKTSKGKDAQAAARDEFLKFFSA